MTDKKAKGLVIGASIFLLLVGGILYYIFDRQGYANSGNSNFVKYEINDYVEVNNLNLDSYNDVYNNIKVSKVNIKNIDNDGIKTFIHNEDNIIGYITGYYNEIKQKDSYTSSSSAVSSIKKQINGTVLSVLYRIDFELDPIYFEDSSRSYITVFNVDLATGKSLSTDDLLLKYNYTKDYIADKIFIEDILIPSDQIVIDKSTNISLTRSDIERRKSEYINRIVSEFDNIIKVYIDNNNLTLVYDKKELNSLFFDTDIDTDIKTRYLR